MKVTETEFSLSSGESVYLLDGDPAIFDGWNQQHVPNSGPHIDDFFCGGEYLGEDENGLAPKFRCIDEKIYCLTATHDDGGNRCLSDRHHALGGLANTVFRNRDETEALAKELQADVGDVDCVDESTQYHVEVFVG